MPLLYVDLSCICLWLPWELKVFATLGMLITNKHNVKPRLSKTKVLENQNSYLTALESQTICPHQSVMIDCLYNTNTDNLFSSYFIQSSRPINKSLLSPRVLSQLGFQALFLIYWHRTEGRLCRSKCDWLMCACSLLRSAFLSAKQTNMCKVCFHLSV